MFRAGQLIGRSVMDGAEEKIGTLEGLAVVRPGNQLYLVVEGDRVLEIRGRRKEFIPSSKTSEIGRLGVYLTPSFAELGQDVKKIDLEGKKIYRFKNLVGLSVIDYDQRQVGEVTDMLINLEGNRPQLLVKGGWVKAMRGNDEEPVDFIDIDSVSNVVKLDINIERWRQWLGGL